MRLPPNLKYLLLFILLIGVIVAATIYLPKIIPGIGQIAQWVLIGGIGVIVIFTFIKPFIGFLYARADGVFAVYKDVNGKGFHVFSYHLSSGGEYGPSSREVQHYYIRYDNGKLLYKKIYAHDMEPATGRSGWTGFDSFEQTILPCTGLKKSMLRFSASANLPLGLSEKIEPENDEDYRFVQDRIEISLNKYEGAVDEGFIIRCTQDDRLLWKKRI